MSSPKRAAKGGAKAAAKPHPAAARPAEPGLKPSVVKLWIEGIGEIENRMV
ncbi:MAG: hypothetical protein ABSE22_22370 [Xanthobacteraceae bacterium]